MPLDFPPLLTPFRNRRLKRRHWHFTQRGLPRQLEGVENRLPYRTYEEEKKEKKFWDEQPRTQASVFNIISVGLDRQTVTATFIVLTGLTSCQFIWFYHWERIPGSLRSRCCQVYALAVEYDCCPFFALRPGLSDDLLRQIGRMSKFVASDMNLILCIFFFFSFGENGVD